MKYVVGFPDYSISADGIVRLGMKRIPTSNIEDANGIFMLAYEIGSQILPVREALSLAFHGGKLLLPTDGNFFNWNTHNQTVIDGAYSARDEQKCGDITFIWWLHKRSFTCEMIASEKRLMGRHKRIDVFNIIRDVMIAGIR
jgi:hypothetical protein